MKIKSAVLAPVSMTAITQSHVADVDATKALQAEVNPMYDVDDLM
jgi:hypothetical protein